MEASILFAPVPDQEVFVRDPAPSTLAARRVVLGVLAKRLGPEAFEATFRDLEGNGVHSLPGIPLHQAALGNFAAARALWGQRLVVPTGGPDGRGEVVFCTLEESPHWDLGPFDDARLDEALSHLEKIMAKPLLPMTVQVLMPPFRWDRCIPGDSWMLPLYLALLDEAAGNVAPLDMASTGAIRPDGTLEVAEPSVSGKVRTLRLFGFNKILAPSAAKLPGLLQATHLREVKKIHDQANLLNLEGRSDREVAQGIKSWKIANNRLHHVLPALESFEKDVLTNPDLARQYPRSLDLARRLMTPEYLYTGRHAAAVRCLERCRAALDTGELGTFDPLTEGDDWLQHHFDYFFLQSTTLIRLGQLDEARRNSQERIDALQMIRHQLEGSGIPTSNRLRYSLVKGLATLSLCHEEFWRQNGDYRHLQAAWVPLACEDYRGHLNHYLQGQDPYLPQYITPRLLRRSLYHPVQVATRLRFSGQELGQEALQQVLDWTRAAVARWGPDPTDMFFAITRMRSQWLAGELDAVSLEQWRLELHWYTGDVFFNRALEALDELGRLPKP